MSQTERKKIQVLITFILITISVCLSGCIKTEVTKYGDGTLKSSIRKKGNHFHGRAVWYYPNGVRQQECYYNTDTLQGTSTRWFNNGKIQSIENFDKGRQNGLFRSYNENGRLLVECMYRNDTLSGPYKEFHPAGSLKAEGNYNKGRYDGKWLYYAEDGTLVGLGEFSDGNGKLKSWYPDGALKRLINYENNQKHGKEVWYLPGNRIERVLTYIEGELIETSFN